MAQISKLLNNDVVSKAEIALKNLGKYGVLASRLQIILAAKNTVLQMYVEYII